MQTMAHAVAPSTVNPSLWRQARLNMHNGLFQVTDRIYQVRGFDISNMTLIEGDRGVIIIDPRVCTETARAALELYFTYRGSRPVVAVRSSRATNPP
jgi:alkyl sulfatase BDS1-like metallo-beta-lactamase superfamily hydrolase